MASGQEHGIFRVVFDNAAETNPRMPIDFATVVISGGALAAPTGAALDAISTTGVFKQAGERLVVYFVANATDIVESEESNWEVPVLIREAKAPYKIVGRTTLTMEGMTGFTAAGTVDVTATAATPARLAHKDAPTGMIYQLDPNGKVRAYLGDDA